MRPFTIDKKYRIIRHFNSLMKSFKSKPFVYNPNETIRQNDLRQRKQDSNKRHLCIAKTAIKFDTSNQIVSNIISTPLPVVVSSKAMNRLTGNYHNEIVPPEITHIYKPHKTRIDTIKDIFVKSHPTPLSSRFVYNIIKEQPNYKFSSKEDLYSLYQAVCSNISGLVRKGYLSYTFERTEKGTNLYKL